MIWLYSYLAMAFLWFGFNLVISQRCNTLQHPLVTALIAGVAWPILLIWVLVELIRSHRPSDVP